MSGIKIKKVTKLGHKLDRYDLTVSSTNNFYANGVLIHNTSSIVGNVKVKTPRFGGLYAKLFNYLPGFLQMTNEGYDVIYSSRTVIKNSKINENVGQGYYSVDIWTEYGEMLRPFIPQGMTVYGEIFGYETGKPDKMIQKGYDYGCKPGENKLMIYRIKTVNEDGTPHEWDVEEVRNWTVALMREHQEIADRLHPIDILYKGKMKDLYPDLSTTEHWHENVLARMKTDVEHFGMEKREPMCKNKVPREGIVLRINGDTTAEAWKLKTDAFFAKEAADIDSGEWQDIEAEERYA